MRPENTEVQQDNIIAQENITNNQEGIPNFNEDQEHQPHQPPFKKSNQFQFQCSVCPNSSRPKQAEYVNLSDFKSKRYLCSCCLKSLYMSQKDLFVIPLEPNQMHPSQVADFMYKATINKNNPEAKMLMQKINQIYKQQIEKKIQLLFQRQRDYTRKLQKDLAMQFAAVYHTFNPKIIQQFI